MALPTSIELLLRQSGRGVGQINSRSRAKQSALAPYGARAQENYAPAISGQQRLGDALSGSLVAQGNQLAGGIESALAGIQAPSQAISTHAGGTAAAGAGAGAASGALSSAELGRLRSTQSAEQIYAAALPRLAQLAGDQERRGFLAQAQQELSDLALREADRAAENARYEREWAYKVGQDAQDRKRQGIQDHIERSRYRSETKYDRGQDRQDRKREGTLDAAVIAAGKQEYGLDFMRTQQAQQRIDISQGNLALATRRQGESERQFQTRERRYWRQFEARLRAAEKTGRKPNAALSAKYGYIVDSYGSPILTKQGKPVPVRSDSGSSGPPPWRK